MGRGVPHLFRLLLTGAAPERRGGLIANIYVVAYLAVSLPAIAAGICTTAFGLLPTAIVYMALVTALTAIAFACQLAQRPVQRLLEEVRHRGSGRAAVSTGGDDHGARSN